MGDYAVEEGPFRENNEKRTLIAAYMRGVTVLFGKVIRMLTDEELGKYAVFSLWGADNVIGYSGQPTDTLEKEFRSQLEDMERILKKYNIPDHDLTPEALEFHAKDYENMHNTLEERALRRDGQEVLDVLSDMASIIRSRIKDGKPIDVKYFLKKVSDIETE